MSVATPETRPPHFFDRKWQNRIKSVKLPDNEKNAAFLSNESISPLTRFLFLVATYFEAEAIMTRLDPVAQKLVIREIEEFASLHDFGDRQWMYLVLLSYFWKKNDSSFSTKKTS